MLFRNRANAPESQKAKQVQELLNYVEEIARKKGKPYMNDLAHEILQVRKKTRNENFLIVFWLLSIASQENEISFQEKQKEILELKTGGFTERDMSQMMEDMKKSRENQLLNEMVERVMCFDNS